MKRTTFNHKASLAFALLGLSAIGPASAATINVIPGGSIQAAVDAAASGDTIQIAAGVYEEQVLILGKTSMWQARQGQRSKRRQGW